MINEIERPDREKYIFAVLFDVVNKLQILGDRELKDTGITTRQWFLMLLIQKREPEAPTLGECAREMGTSHQNIRQLTTRLERRGFLRVQSDSKDMRILRLYLTDDCAGFWNSRSGDDIAFISSIFKDFSSLEINKLFLSMEKLQKTLNKDKI